MQDCPALYEDVHYRRCFTRSLLQSGKYLERFTHFPSFTNMSPVAPCKYQCSVYIGFLHHNNVSKYTNKFMFCWAAMCFSHQRLTLQGDFWSNKLDNAQHHHLKHQMREYLRKNAVHASSKAKQAWGICAEEDGGLFSGQIPYNISLVYW